MADLLTSSYHAIGNYGAMYGCISWKYEKYDTYYRVYIYWLGEGLKTTASDASSTYSLSTSATIKGEVLVNGTSKKSWTATASGTRSGYATYSSYVWFKAGGSNANYYDIPRTSSAQTVTFKVTYTVSGYSSRTGTATLTIPAGTKVTINYNSNGGTGSMSPTVYTKASSGSINLSANTFTKTGCSFNKWNLAANGSSTSYSNKQAWSLTNDNTNHSYTLYAQWTNLGPFTITFNANGGTSGSVSSLIKTYGNPITIPKEAKPTRKGYVFKGWSTSARSTSVSYNVGSTYSTEASATLYAVWQEQTIIIKYDKNTDAKVTNMPSNQTMQYWTDTSINISSNTPQRTDYTFMGWSYLQSGGELIQPGDTFNNPRPQTEIILYAQWDTATITYYYWNNIATPYIQNVAIGSNGNLWSTQSNKLPDIVVNNVTYEFSGKWVKLSADSTSSLTNDSFLKTDNNRESLIGGQTTYTNVQGNNSYAATYQRKSPRPETDSPYMFYIRTNRVFLPEFISKTESEFAQLEDVNGKFISGYVRFTSPYPKGTVVNTFPQNQTQSTTKNAEGLLVRATSNYAITDTVDVTITPGYTGVGGTISGTAIVIFKGNYVYLFSCLGDGITDLNDETQTITLSWDTDEIIVTNDYGVELSPAEYVYNLLGINYIVDINSTGTMLSVGGEAYELTTIDGVERLPVATYTGIRTITSGNVTTTQQQQIDPYKVTAFYNPIYVSDINNDLIPAITEGRIEDEVVLSSATILRWKQLLGL